MHYIFKLGSNGAQNSQFSMHLSVQGMVWFWNSRVCKASVLRCLICDLWSVLSTDKLGILWVIYSNNNHVQEVVLCSSFPLGTAEYNFSCLCCNLLNSPSRALGCCLTSMASWCEERPPSQQQRELSRSWWTQRDSSWFRLSLSPTLATVYDRRRQISCLTYWVFLWVLLAHIHDESSAWCRHCNFLYKIHSAWVSVHWRHDKSK